MSKKCSRLRWATKPIAFFDEVLNEKPHTFYFVEMCAVYLYTLWINTIERRCCIRFACRISEHR